MDRKGGQLEGLRVLELGSLIAGPFCTRLLGDMGARIIKVEPPGGDPLRNWGMVTEQGSLWSMVQSRNKESVVIDLRHHAANNATPSDVRLPGDARIVAAAVGRDF